MSAKRGKTLLALLLCAALCAGCAPVGVNPMLEAVATVVPGTDPILPEAQEDGSAALQTHQQATLYFRFLDEPLLAPESRTITQAPSQSYEMALLGELLSGPGTHSADLNGLFPEGTRVLSTVKQGRTLFVTLSDEIMNGYPDEPSAWRDGGVWQTEVPLRRVLCMQSLVATVTENCDVDQVQVLVQQDQAAVGSLRLKQRYFMDGSDDSVLVGPMTRDDALLLTPDTTLRVLLDCWQSQDWQRMYRYLALRDPSTGAERAPERDFVTAMEQLSRLTGADFTGGSLSASGTCMTYTLSAHLMDGTGSEWDVSDRVVRLYQEGDRWKTTLEQLTGWLEE